LKILAHALILIHKHPSGNLRTSDADLKITKKIKDGDRLLDIDVLYHLIITDEGYYSMADEGVM
jgi:DNA repair protein RadC